MSWTDRCVFGRRVFTLTSYFAAAGLLVVPAFAQQVLRVPSQYATIQSALNAGHNGDAVVVDPGTYFERLDFLGKAITVRGAEGAASTIVDGAAGGRVVQFTHGEGPDSRLVDLTIRNGSDAMGAGLYITGASPTIERCTIADNVTPTVSFAYGAGAYLEDSAARFVDCRIADNRAESTFVGEGGGVWLNRSPATFERCRLTRNYAKRSGGGLSASRSDLRMTQCVIDENVSERDGGGMYVAMGSPVFDRCEFRNNLAGGPGATSASGGGAVLGASPVAPPPFFTLYRCVFAGNRAEALNANGGGVLVSGSSGPTPASGLFSGCELRNNEARGSRAEGAAAAFSRATVVLESCIVAENTAVGVTVSTVLSLTDCCPGVGAAPSFVNVTIAKNSARSLFEIFDSAPIVANTIVWANAAPLFTRVAPSFSFCILPQSQPGPGNIVSDPVFVDPNNGDYHLAAGSPAIGAATATVPPPLTLPLRDIDGQDRVQGPAPDIGADEFGTQPFFLPDTPCDDTLGATVGVPVSFPVHAAAGSGGTLTLTVSGVPAGARHVPPLPASGSSVATVFEWTPSNAQAGRHAITYTAKDATGQETKCTVTILAAECYLILGTRPIALPLGSGDMLLTSTNLLIAPVTLTTIPVIPVPDDTEFSGATVFAQVVMFNPDVFPRDPLQLTNGIAVTLGVGSSAYGSGGSGMRLWLSAPPTRRNGLRFAFSIPGM